MKSKIREPKVGEDIYIPTQLFLSHGMDDFLGGLCQIVRVKKGISAGEPTWFVSVAEDPGTEYNWEILLEKQNELKAKCGDRRGRPDPDDRPEFNRWD
jgi:hypothetical protein